MFDFVGMMPGMPTDVLGGMSDADGAKRIKTYLCIIDSMTDSELHSDGKIFYKEPSRKSPATFSAEKRALGIKRIAQGSGGRVMEVEELLQQHGMFAGMVKKMGGSKGMLNQMKKGMEQTVLNLRLGAAGRGGGNPAAANPLSQIGRMLPPGMLDQMGGKW